jgi:hypothetical protein
MHSAMIAKTSAYHRRRYDATLDRETAPDNLNERLDLD